MARHEIDHQKVQGIPASYRRGALPRDPAVLNLCKNTLSAITAMDCEVDDVRVDFDLERAWQAVQTLRSWMLIGSLIPLAVDPATRDLPRLQSMWETANGQYYWGRGNAGGGHAYECAAKSWVNRLPPALAEHFVDHEEGATW